MFLMCDHGENWGRGDKGHLRVPYDANTLRALVGDDFDTTCLMNSGWELDTPAVTDDGVDGEEHRDGEDETE